MNEGKEEGRSRIGQFYFIVAREEEKNSKKYVKILLKSWGMHTCECGLQLTKGGASRKLNC